MILKIIIYFIAFAQIINFKIINSSSPSEPDPDGPCVQLNVELCNIREDCKTIQGETCCGEIVDVCANADADCESSGQFGCFEVLGVRMTLPFCNPTIFDLFDPNPQCINEDGNELCTSNITRCSQKLNEYCESDIYTSCCSRSALCSYIPSPPIILPNKTEPPYTPQVPSATQCELKTSIDDCLSDPDCDYEVIGGCCGSQEVICISKNNICNYDQPKCGYYDYNYDFFFLIPTCSIPLPYLHEENTITPGCYSCPNSTECQTVSVDICDDHLCCYRNEECLIVDVTPTPPTPPPIFTTTSDTPIPPDSSELTTGGSIEPSTTTATTSIASTIDTTIASTSASTIVSTISTSSTVAEVTTASTIREITTAETTIASTIATTIATTLASTISGSSTTLGGSTISTSSTGGSIDDSDSNICDDLVCPPNYQCKIIHNGQSGVCVPSKCKLKCHTKDHECRIINGKEECVPNYCLDCSDLGCDKQGLICKMIKSTIFSDHIDKSCCQYTPTCLSKRNKYPNVY